MSARLQSLETQFRKLASSAEEQSAFQESLSSLLPEVAPPLLSKMRKVGNVSLLISILLLNTLCTWQMLHNGTSRSRKKSLKHNIIKVQRTFRQLLPGGELTEHEVSRDPPPGFGNQIHVPVKTTHFSDIFKGDYLDHGPCAMKRYRHIAGLSEGIQRVRGTREEKVSKSMADFVFPYSVWPDRLMYGLGFIRRTREIISFRSSDSR